MAFNNVKNRFFSYNLTFKQISTIFKWNGIINVS